MSRQITRPITSWIVAVPALLAAPPALAGGQFVGDNGSQGMQRAGAFAAKADDATALYYNPGALFQLDGRQFFLGANLVDLNQTFKRLGTYQAQADGDPATFTGDEFPTVAHEGAVQPVPFLALAVPGRKVAFAAGVFAPHGYGSRAFPEAVDTANGTGAPAPQRYDTVSQDGLIAFPSAAIAVRMSDSLSVGGRLSYGFGRFQSRRVVQGLANPEEDPGRDSTTDVDVSDDRIITWAVGAHYVSSPRFELAAVYTARVSIDAVGTSSSSLGEDIREVAPGVENQIDPVPDGEARCAPGGQLGAIATCLDFALPQTLTVGGRLIARDAAGAEIGDFEVDVRWENWAAVSDYRAIVDGKNRISPEPLPDSVLPHGFQNSLSIRAGGSGRIVRGGRPYELRAGVAYDTAATPPSWTRLDVDGLARFTAAAGVGVFLGDYRLDIGAAYIDGQRRNLGIVPVADVNDPAQRVQPDVPVPSSAAEAQPYHPFNSGTYTSRYLVASLGLSGYL